MTTETSTMNAGGQDTTGAGEQTSTTADGTKPGDQGTDTSGQGQSQDGQGEGQKADDKGATVPEKYDFSMPEGVDLDTAAADEFSAIAKDLKLTQEQAQKVADVGAKMAQRQQEQHQATVQQWVESVKTDKEIGGDKLEENLSVARKAMDTYGTPELKDVLNATGLGNHPAFVKLFYKVGKTLSDDSVVRGGNTAATSDPAKKMFPSMN